MIRELKIFFGVLLAVNVIFSASFALGADEKSKQIFSSMELSYPNIPGLGRFSDYQNLDPSLQIGFIISYIFKLVFFISIGAGLVALLVAGVMYLVSSSKPKWIMLSRQMASNAMLGLFILLCAYLLLYVINPQLLSLTLTKPKLDQIVSTTANPFSADTTVATRVSVTESLNSAVDNLQEKVYLVLNNKNEPTGQYAEKLKGDSRFCYSDGYGGAMKGDGKTYLRDLLDTDPIKINGCETAGIITNGDKFVYRAEIPLRETAEALKIISPLVKELKIVLEQCKCGMSLGWSDYSLGNPGCKPGRNPKDTLYKTYQNNGYFCLNQADDCGMKKMIAGGATYLNCDLRDVRRNVETGKIEVCMRDDGYLPLPCKATDACWVATDGRKLSKEIIDPPNDTCGVFKAIISYDPRVNSLIRLKVLKIQEEQAKMQARSRIDARFLDSATLIARALDANSMEFSTSQATGYWGFDFSEKAKNIKNLVIQDSKDTGETTAPTAGGGSSGGSSGAGFNVPKGNGFLARLKSLVSPFVTGLAMAQSQYVGDNAGTFYYITTAPESVQALDITAKNKAIARDARRYNLFSLLTDLPLEGIETIFRDCLTAAFGVADYSLDQGQIQDVIEAVMATGAGDHLKAVIQKMIDDQTIADKIVIDTGQAIADDATVAFIKPFLIQCKSANVSCPAPDTEAAQLFVKKLFDKNCPILTDTCCYCVKNLMSNGVPPNYLSKTFSAVFTTSLATKLPYINGILNTNVIAILFPQNDPNHPIGDFLNTPSKDIYNAIFKGALTQKFQDKIPGLNTLLDKQMKDVLPDFIVSEITKINTWFENTVSSTKSLVKSASNKMAEGLVKEYVSDPMHEWAQNQFDKLGIGIEHLTIGECFKGLEKGYIYKADDGKTGQSDFLPGAERYNTEIMNGELSPREPGKCFLMTPAEINQVYKEDLDVPQNFNYLASNVDQINPKINTIGSKPVIYFGGAFSAAQSICEGAGYAWEGGDGGVGCWRKDDLAKDTQAAVDTISSLDKTKTYVAGGLVTYAEKMATAFTETALQFALAYARVFVEDNFITPLLGYWNQISGFQQGMQNFLTTSVKGILPAQISGFLQSNIVDQLNNFCDGKEGYIAKKKALPEGHKGDNVEMDLSFNLPDGVTWKDGNRVEIPVISVPQETGDAICKVESSLSVTPWGAITDMCNRNEATANPEDKVVIETKLCKAVKTLNSKLETALSNVCEKITGGPDPECDIDTWFKKPLISIFSPNLPLGTINTLINATPKQLLCGELPILEGGKTPVAECANIISNKFGLIPTFAKSSDLNPWCAFIYTGCQTAIPAQETKIGVVIKKLVNTYCAGDVGKGTQFCNLIVKKIVDILIEAKPSLANLLEKLANGQSIQTTMRETLNLSEILRLTPYQAITTYVCPNTAEGSDERALCDSLGKTPQEIMGLDKPLRDFIRPKEFIILFDMLQNDLKDGNEVGCGQDEIFDQAFFEKTGQGICCANDNLNLCYKVGEKPAALKQLLDFMSATDPITALSNLQQTMPTNAQGSSEVFPYVTAVSDLEKYPNCLKSGIVGATIKSGCSPAAVADLEANGLSGNNQIVVADANQGIDIFFESEIYITKESIQGMVINTKNAVAVRYYFVRPLGENIILVYKEPNPTKVAFGNALDFMQIPIGDVINKVFGEKTITDYICEQIKFNNANWCDEAISESWKLKDKQDKIKSILNSTALDLIEKYLDKSLSIKPAKSLMDMVSANTALGQPMIDTFGALTGLDKIIKTKIGDPIVGFTSKAAQWADNGAKAGVKSIQDGLNNALVEWPKSLAPEWLAEFYGFNVGENAADDIAGSCYDKPGATDVSACNKPKEEILKDAGTPKAQCCILAKGESCQPRCREVDAKVKQCDVLSGERAKVEQRMIDGSVHYICCFVGVAGVDDIGVGFHDTEEMNCFPKSSEAGCASGEIPNPVLTSGKECCLPTIKLCKKARAVDFSAGGKCRTQNENGDTYEEKDEANGVCKFVEDYKQTLPPAPNFATPTIEDQGFCCSTVSQCIANRFSSHLENIAEMMADGNIPLQSLKK